ncbi:MAG: response regulator [Anaerolineales bacterium]
MSSQDFDPLPADVRPNSGYQADMASPNDLAIALRWALRRLYDPVALRSSPLIPLLGLDKDPNPAKRLRQVLIDGIAALEPGPGVPEQSRAWRLHEILLYRYVQQCGQQEVADQLGLGVRHLRREEADAIAALAQVLAPQVTAATPPPSAAAEPGEHQPAPSATDQARCVTPLTDVLPGVLETVAALAAQAEVQLDATDPATDALCCVEPMALRQALISLLCVAVRQTPGGRVQVDVRSGPAQTEISIVGSRRVRPVSRDADDLDNLALISRLLAGTDALLTLSAPEEAFAASLTFPSRVAVPVLLIDDNPDTLTLLQRYAAGSAYRIQVLAQPERALEVARQSQPQLIVLDVMMPTIDGWELLGRLRQHPATRHIPVIVCTVLAQEDLARSLGASDFVHKPVTRQDFLAALERQSPTAGAQGRR